MVTKVKREIMAAHDNTCLFPFLIDRPSWLFTNITEEKLIAWYLLLVRGAKCPVELVEVHASWPEYHGHTRGLPSQFQEPRVDRGCIFVENLAHMCSLSLISSLMHRPAKSAEAKAWRICTRQMLLAAMHKKLQYMRLNLYLNIDLWGSKKSLKCQPLSKGVTEWSFLDSEQFHILMTYFDSR